MTTEERTITYKGVELTCVFDYQPEEPMEMYDRNNTGYPGCPADISDIYVYIGDVDITELVEDELKKIEEEIWKTL
jgi:hypothetical protein